MLACRAAAVSGDDVAAAVEMPVRPADIAGLRHRDRDHCHFWPTEVVEIGLVIGRRMNRGKRADDLERVTVCTARDQRIQAVLWSRGRRRCRTAAGERRNAPRGGIGSVRGVPGLMGAMKVAQTDVQEPYRRRSVERPSSDRLSRGKPLSVRGRAASWWRAYLILAASSVKRHAER